MFTRNQVREYGIDGHALVVGGDGLVTGRMLATQVKGGASRFRRAAADGSGWTFWSDNHHLHYWLGYHVPVLLVLVRLGDGAAFWQVIRPSTVTEHAKGFTMVIPSSQRLDASADEQLLLAIAVNERGLLESFPAHCKVLTPQVRPRARLHRGGRRGTRTGRRRPGPAAGARARGGRSGLSCPGTGPRARAHLEQACAGGEDLLADIGLVELAVSDGDRTPPEIPASVQAATPDQLAAEPAVLGFLAGRFGGKATTSARCATGNGVGSRHHRFDVHASQRPAAAACTSTLIGGAT